MKPRFCTMLLCTLVFGLSVAIQPACGETEDNRSLVRLRLSALPTVSSAPIYIALHEGYFTEHGIDLEIVKFKSSSDALPALAQGQLEIVTGSVSATFYNAIARGLQVKAVADKTHKTPDDRSSAIMVRSELYHQQAVRSLADLAGRSLAFSGRGRKMEYLLEETLAHWGLTFNEVEPVYLAQTARAQALQTGAVDAALLAEPLVTRLLLSGHGEILVYDGELYSELSVSPQTSLVYFGPTLLVDQPQWGRRFMLAYLRGVRTYNEGKTPRNLEIIARYTGLEPEILAQTGWPHINPDGRMATEGIPEFQQWLLRQGLMDDEISLDALFDPSFAAWAADTLSKRES